MKKRLDPFSLVNPYISSCCLRDPTSRALQRTDRLRGFTLVELASTLIILSIMAFVVVPRFFDRRTLDDNVYDDRVQSMLSHAQKVAIAQNRNVFVLLSNARFEFCFDQACSDKVIAPASALAQCGDTTWMCESKPASVSIAPMTSGFSFNALGKPFNLSDTPPASSFTNRLDIAMPLGGTARHIYIEPETGYVHP